MNEYFICHGDRRLLKIYYCPFCGGRNPESRRESLFEFIPSDEETRIFGLFREIRTERDVKERFGPPDREQEIGSITVYPEKGLEPTHGKTFRTLTYFNLSPVAEITFEVGNDGRARGSWYAKPKRAGNG